MKIPKSELDRIHSLYYLQAIEQFRNAIVIGWPFVVSVIVVGIFISAISFAYNYLTMMP